MTGKRNLMIAVLGVALALITSTMASALDLNRKSYNNWHVHDGGTGTDANGLVHKGVAFFPTIFTDGDIDAYKDDASLYAYCPNGTDKTLLHDGDQLGENLRSGVCMNAQYIIHLRTVREANIGYVPDGWTYIDTETVGGIVYKTFYLLTPK